MVGCTGPDQIAASPLPTSSYVLYHVNLTIRVYIRRLTLYKSHKITILKGC